MKPLATPPSILKKKDRIVNSILLLIHAIDPKPIIHTAWMIIPVYSTFLLPITPMYLPIRYEVMTYVTDCELMIIPTTPELRPFFSSAMSG